MGGFGRIGSQARFREDLGFLAERLLAAEGAAAGVGFGLLWCLDRIARDEREWGRLMLELAETGKQLEETRGWLLKLRAACGHAYVGSFRCQKCGHLQEQVGTDGQRSNVG